MPFNEKELVEEPFVKRLEEEGWKFSPGEELERDDVKEPLLLPLLIKSIKNLNPDPGIGDEEISRAINELKLTPTGPGGARKILQYFREGIKVKSGKEKTIKNIRLFDFEHPENNTFTVSTQVKHTGRENIRNDIILYINGIPVVNIECKNPARISESWYNAYVQIKEYERLVPELYKYIQIGVAVERKAKYFPIVPWEEEVERYEWKEEGMDSIESTLKMLSPYTLLDIIGNFIFVRTRYGKTTKVITRYMQYRAANKIVKRVMENLEGRDRKNKGLIWHWQGSGKTLTMIFAAHKLFYSKKLEHPTIFFIVDRLDLEEQLREEFSSLDVLPVEVIGSIRELRETLSFDNYRGKRGVFITLVHKFRNEELEDIRKELKKLSREKETIMNRKNVIAFVDEGHRTQSGILASTMRSILKEAFFFAFTGTPLAKRGRDTYRNFSYPPEELYLDKYFITDSIRDGFTLKIVYQPRLDRLHLKKDLLEAFLRIEEEELPDEIREEVEEAVKKKLNTIKLFHEKPDRIEEIAKDISEHFLENVDGRFKAMVVAGSRKACVIYKHALDTYLPPEYSEVVMTYEAREKEKIIEKYRNYQREKFRGKDEREIREDIVRKFREEKLPKILIVTDMLLTGFDAPILQTMYLDKPLKEHRLLQAIARTNRPYGNLKEAGLIIDYVGISKEFKRAFEMYAKEDIEGSLFNMNDLKMEFINLIEELMEIFESYGLDYGRDTLTSCLEIITHDKEVEEKFVENYQRMRKIFEMLGAEEIKLEHLEEYRWLTAVYTYYTKMVKDESPIGAYVERYYQKTIEFVHRTTEVEKIEKELKPVVFDEHYLERLEEEPAGMKEKAAAIVFALNRLVLVEKHENPVYESLADRIEMLLEMWRERKVSYEELFSIGKEIWREKEKLEQRQRELGFDDVEYAMLLALEKELGKKKEFVEDVRELSQEIKPLMFEGWYLQRSARQEVKKRIRRWVRKLKTRYGFEYEKVEEIFRAVVEGIERYGK